MRRAVLMRETGLGVGTARPPSLFVEVEQQFQSADQLVEEREAPRDGAFDLSGRCGLDVVVLQVQDGPYQADGQRVRRQIFLAGQRLESGGDVFPQSRHESAGFRRRQLGRVPRDHSGRVASPEARPGHLHGSERAGGREPLQDLDPEVCRDPDHGHGDFTHLEGHGHLVRGFAHQILPLGFGPLIRKGVSVQDLIADLDCDELHHQVWAIFRARSLVRLDFHVTEDLVAQIGAELLDERQAQRGLLFLAQETYHEDRQRRRESGPDVGHRVPTRAEGHVCLAVVVDFWYSKKSHLCQ